MTDPQLAMIYKKHKGTTLINMRPQLEEVLIVAKRFLISSIMLALGTSFYGKENSEERKVS